MPRYRVVMYMDIEADNDGGALYRVQEMPADRLSLAIDTIVVKHGTVALMRWTKWDGVLKGVGFRARATRKALADNAS